MDVEWGPDKAASHLLKQEVDFADAVTALEDEAALTRSDPDAQGEERFVSLGMDAQGRVLVTVFRFRTDAVRVISSPRASRAERRLYGDD
jgi:uncharacterized DUF497 family protein